MGIAVIVESLSSSSLTSIYITKPPLYPCLAVVITLLTIFRGILLAKKTQEGSERVKGQTTGYPKWMAVCEYQEYVE